MKALNEIKSTLGWRVLYSWVGDDRCGHGDLPLVRCDMFSASGLQSCDRTVSTILSFSWLYLVTWAPGMHEHLEAISWLEINKILCNLASMTNTSVLVMDFNSMNCKIMFTACLKLHASSIIFTHTCLNAILCILFQGSLCCINSWSFPNSSN